MVVAVVFRQILDVEKAKVDWRSRQEGTVLGLPETGSWPLEARRYLM
jgi:hypothetical protein